MNVEYDVQSESESLTMNSGTALGKAPALPRGSIVKRTDASRARVWVLTTATCSVLAMATLAVVAYVRFGSITGGLAYLAGDRLIVDHREKSFGDVADGSEKTVMFRVTNITERAVSVLGARTQCTCVVADELPLTIAVSETGTLKVIVRKGAKTGALRESVCFYTDSPERSQIVVSLFGRIID